MALNIEWSEEARADIRRLDKPTARRIFDAALRFARTGQGDIKQLQGEYAGKTPPACRRLPAVYFRNRRHAAHSLRAPSQKKPTAKVEE